MSAVIAVVAFGALFALFGLLLRGREEAPRCSGCDGRCGGACPVEEADRGETRGSENPNQTGGVR